MSRSPLSVSPQQLAAMELFERLPPAALAEVAACARLRTVAHGTTLFNQGQRAAYCHALISGCVRIAQSGEDGGQLVVRFIGPGQMFGTVALFTDRVYPAGAVAVLDCLEARWSEPVLLALIHKHPPIALNLVKIVGMRLREVQERLREISTQRAEQRIARLLLRTLAQRRDGGHQERTIEFPLTRQDIATMCGLTLYTASRVLTAWQRAGYLATRSRRLTILEQQALRRIAGSPVRRAAPRGHRF